MMTMVSAMTLAAGAVVLLFRVKTAWCVLQVVGAGGLLVVILCHLCEALHLLPWMGWGLEHSPVITWIC